MADWIRASGTNCATKTFLITLQVYGYQLHGKHVAARTDTRDSLLCQRCFANPFQWSGPPLTLLEIKNIINVFSGH